MKLPLPQRGQPFDVAFIYDIVNSVNELWSKVTVSASAYASLWTINGRKINRNSEVKFVTGYVKLPKPSADVAAGTKVDFEYFFDLAFKYPPVVTVSPVSAGTATGTAKSATAMITTLTTNMVKGSVRFDEKGTYDIGINIIAIGVPN